MNPKRQTNNKKGVAIFFVLFVMVILGILITQFHLSSRQAQNSVHRFQTSEMARQLAAAAQEEAFKYLYKETDNYESKGFDELNANSILRKIIEGKESSVYVPNFNRTETNGIKLNIPSTEELAESLMGDRMEISATARIIDFRDSDPDNHTFYGKEGIGTIEIVTSAKAKEKYKNQFPGACTNIRHHDFKIVSLLSKSDRDNYADSRVLDYALFIRKGQEEFESGAKGTSVNSEKISLEINAGDFPGKVNFGSGKANYQYLNIASDTIDFLGEARNIAEITELKANEEDTNRIYPYFKSELSRQCSAQGGYLISLTGHKAIFEFYRLPLTDKYYENDEQLKEIRFLASANAQKKLNKNISFNTDSQPYFYDGIKILPIQKLKEILTSDIRKQFINIGFFKLDLTDCCVTVGAKKADPKTLVIKTDKPELIEQYKKEPFYCFDTDYHIPYIQDPNNDAYTNKINMKELNKYIKDKGLEIASKAFTYINDEFLYQLEDEPPNINEDNFHNKEYLGGYSPSEAQYPFAHFNLFNKRYINNDKPEELEEFGIYDKKENILNLRGIVQCSNHVELGDENSTLKIKGSGVLIARGITIKGAIEKDNKKSVAVLFARNGDIRIKTSKKIEAALIAMKGPDGDGINQGVNGRVIAEEALNLKGSLATDYINLSQWKKEVSHKIEYDEALIPTKDVYQVNIANWVTYERVLENE